MTTIERIKNARRVSTPLLSVSTTDQNALVIELTQALNGNTPVIVWNAIQGYSATNEAGNAALSGYDPEDLTMSATNPVESLRIAAGFPERSVILWHNAPLFLEDPFVRQGIANLRDIYKADTRTFIMMGIEFNLPVELRSDVIQVTDTPPTDAQVKAMITELIEGAGIEGENLNGQIEQTVDAVRGAGSLFSAEQITAMSLKPEGIDVNNAWQQKIESVNTIKGLTLSYNKPQAEIGGLSAIQEYMARLCREDNPEKPHALVFIDEIEKALAGIGTAQSAGESTGTAKGTLGYMLTFMDSGNDRDANAGLLLVGPPGTGKSLTAQTLAARHNLPMFTVDMGETKGSLLGETEQNVRQVFNAIDSVAAGSSLVIATCNQLDILPPELKRRFTEGTWYLDLPTLEEIKAIMGIHAQGLRPEQIDLDPETLEGYTGAEIRNLCRKAKSLDCTLTEACVYVVPIIKSDPDSVERLRTMAAGKWLSASAPGAYQKEVKKTFTRKIEDVF